MPIRVRLCAGKHPSKKNETRKLRRIVAHCADRHAHLEHSVTGSIEFAEKLGSSAAAALSG
jgi:hypothetical protein